MQLNLEQFDELCRGEKITIGSGESISVEQMCRQLLVIAVEDGWVRPPENLQSPPSGEPLRMANQLQEYLRRDGH